MSRSGLTAVFTASDLRGYHAYFPQLMDSGHASWVIPPHEDLLSGQIAHLLSTVIICLFMDARFSRAI
jgi:hypothetical protein